MSVTRGAYLALLLAASAGTARANDDVVDPCACSPNKPHFHRADAATGGWGGLRQDFLQDGLKISGTYAGEVFAGPGLKSDKFVTAGLFLLALDYTPGEHTAVHIAGLGIHGDGLSQELMDVYGVSNNVADPGVRLFEAWAEQGIGPLTIRAGLLSADQEFILAQHSTVLLGATFGIVSLFSDNVLSPVYPVAEPSVSARLETDAITVRGAVYDTDAPDEHGIPRSFGHQALAIGEVQVAGTFSLGGWHHSDHGNGIYGVIDSKLDRYTGAFARFAHADGPVSTYFDAGIRVGPGPLRPRDFASIGLAFTSGARGPQTILELTYQYLVVGWLTIQPDAQLVMDRQGTEGIIATRMVVAL
ncbi:MAG TPA: carbohydrate porin [Kofleriaceae bacterium]